MIVTGLLLSCGVFPKTRLGFPRLLYSFGPEDQSTSACKGFVFFHRFTILTQIEFPAGSCRHNE